MAKLMPYTDPETGAEHPRSVWLPMFEAADMVARRARIVFLGFASPAALAAGLRPVGQREFLAEGDAFLAFVAAPPDGATLLDAVSNACYALAAGDPFFAGAADVEVTLVPAAASSSSLAPEAP